ncbi:MAG: hypothetical protein KBT09_04920 [Bacteroidales bacterium]|nr:hypothetical protein [Candidatus Sodaliphilus fimicaballi]
MKAIGFPQNASQITNLYNIACLFVAGSKVNRNVCMNIDWLCDHQLEYNGTYYDAADSCLSNLKYHLAMTAPVPYNALKGKGKGNRPSRSAAPCSGLIQAAIEAQKNRNYKNKLTGQLTNKRKPYTDDWSADSYLRLAISIGLLDYDESSDSCTLSPLGNRFASCTGPSDPNYNIVIGEALLTYPPVCRILDLLDSTFGITPGSIADPKMTQFKLGTALGFIGEAGFSSIPENIWLAEYDAAPSPKAKQKVRSDREGTMDKHARMICSLLSQIGWISQSNQTVSGTFCGITYSAELQCYYITLSGHNAFVKSRGNSSNPRIPKIVYLGSLATRSSDADYLSSKRAYIIDCISGTKHKNLVSIQASLATNGFSESISTIKDDIEGLRRIGIQISVSNAGKYHVDDVICKLTIPKRKAVTPSTVVGIVNSLRSSLSSINHKYLNLINYSIDANKNRDLEQLTLELLTSELGFNGKWLGGTSKPDGIISENTKGLIIDTKAYSGGYNLPRSQKDEMFRYISDFVFKNVTVNPTQWWINFPSLVTSVGFTFVSSNFTATVPNGLTDISNRTISINSGVAIKGGAITTKVLLEKAEEVKSGRLSKADFMHLFSSNNIIV